MKRDLLKLIWIALFAVMLSSCSSNEESIKLFPIKAGDKWGYIDKKGEYVINTQFDRAFNFSEGMALVKTTEGKYGFIGEDGKYKINAIYKDAGKFSEGLAAVVSEGGKPQYIDKEGKIIFTVDKADFCASFYEGMARIKIKGKWGFVDKTGKIIVNANYEKANRFREGLAAVCKVDEKTKENKWGFIDKKGAVKIDFQFSDGGSMFNEPEGFTEGLAFVTSDGKKWGCVNNEGKYEINPQFETDIFNSFGFKNGVSVVKQGESFGYIDKKGKYTINPQFNAANNFAKNGLAAVQSSDKKWGFIDKEGKYAVNPQFEEIANGFMGEVAFVKSSDKYGIIDKKGLYIVNPQYDDVQVYDLNWDMGVESDYLDIDEIAQQLFENSSATKFMGYDKSAALRDIMKIYPEVGLDDLSSYKLKIKKPKMEISEAVEVTDLRYGFDDKTYTETPIYKKEPSYNYYTGSYTYKDVFDRLDKKINPETNLTFISVELQLKSNGKDKAKALAQGILKKAEKAMSAKELTAEDYKNDEKSGIYFLQNDDLLVYLRYKQDTEKDTKQKPEVTLIVINSNFEKTFAELQKTIISDFNKEQEKQNE